MLIDVNKIGLQGLMLQDSIALDGKSLSEDESRFLDAVDYTVQFIREGRQIRARGKIRTRLSLQCVGCLENYETKIDSSFDVVLFPVQLLEVKETNAALSPEEMEYIFFDGKEIDLDQLLLEQVNLFIPYNPMCKEDCKGICPDCGKNLNTETCHCKRTNSEISILFDNI
jgi:uncharacterized protein